MDFTFSETIFMLCAKPEDTSQYSGATKLYFPWLYTIIGATMTELLLNKIIVKDPEQNLLVVAQPDDGFILQTRIVQKLRSSKPKKTKYWIKYCSIYFKPINELQQQLLRRNLLFKSVTKKFFGLIPIINYSVTNRKIIEDLREYLFGVLKNTVQPTDYHLMVLFLLRSGKQLPVAFPGKEQMFYTMAEQRINDLLSQRRENDLEELIADDEQQQRRYNEINVDQVSVELFMDIIQSFDTDFQGAPDGGDGGFDGGFDGGGSDGGGSDGGGSD